MTTLLYTMAWEAYDGQTRRLEIYDLQAEQAVAVPIALTPAVTPFVSEVSSEDEAMQTVLTGSAKMTFIGNWQTLSGIDLTSSVRYRAMLKDTADTILWLGFLKADVSDQAYDQTATEITLNLIDDIEALDAFRIDPEGIELPTMGEYIAECFGNIGTGHTFYFASETFLPTIVLKLKVARRNFLESVSGEMKGRTCKEFIEEFCKTFGYTCHQNGADIYFSRRGSNGSLKFLHYDLTHLDEYTDDEEYTQLKSYLDIEGRGSDNEVVVTQAKKSINIGIENVDAGQDVSIDIDKGATVVKGGGIAKYKDAFKDKKKGMQTGYWYAVALKPKFGDTSVFKFTWPDMWEYVDYDGRDLMELAKAQLAGGMVIADDYWCTSSYDKGSAEISAEKEKIQYSTRILIVPSRKYAGAYYNVPYSLRMEKPFFHIESENDVFINVGGLDISYNIHFYTIVNGNPAKNGREVKQYDKNHYLVCRLKIGEYYYKKGLGWTKTPCTFNLYAEEQEDRSSTSVEKNLRYYYLLDANSHSISMLDADSPHPKNVPYLSGKLEFDIIDVINLWENEAHFGALYDAPVIIDSFNIRYAAPIINPLDYRFGEVYGATDSDINYSELGEGDTGEDQEITLSIHTNATKFKQLGDILDESGNVVTSITPDGVRIENHLLSMYNRDALRPNTFLTIGMNAGNLKEITNVTMADGNTYDVICTKQTDWRTLQSKLHLIKL